MFHLYFFINSIQLTVFLNFTETDYEKFLQSITIHGYSLRVSQNLGEYNRLNWIKLITLFLKQKVFSKNFLFIFKISTLQSSKHSYMRAKP